MTTIITPAAFRIALSVCRGDYQRSLVYGMSSWAGSDLRGTAASYRGRYRDSRDNLITACRNAGLRVQVSRIGARCSFVATILTRKEAARISETAIGGDVCVEGRALAARIERVKRKLTAAARKQARDLAADEAALSELAA